MITTEDMALIVAKTLDGYKMPIYVKGHIPFGAIPSEGRITITPKEDSEGKYFNRCFIEVNFILPDVDEEADYRLDDIERTAYGQFKDGFAGTYEDQWYNITYSHRSREEDGQLKSHYVHLQLLFEILNTL